MSALNAGSNREALAVMCLSALFSSCLLMTSFASASAPNSGVKYKLRADVTAPGSFEVALSFTLRKGEKTLLEPLEPSGSAAEGLATPVVEFRVQPRPEYQVEPVTPGGGISIAANSEVEVEVPYRVSFRAENVAQSSGEASRNAKPPLPIIQPDLQVFKASQVLICPRSPETRSPITDDYVVEFNPGAGHTVMAPWERLEKGYSFKVNGETPLLENYVAMGRIDTLVKDWRNCRITVGFTADYRALTPEQRKQYVDDLTVLFGRISDAMGPRPGLPRLSILVSGVGRFGLTEPAASGLFSSVLTFNGASKLRGESAAVASGSIFELWNRWMIVPSEKGGGQWFQNGISSFYAYRAAAEAGLLESGLAYKEFSQVYLDYVSNPLSLSTSLISAERNANASSLVEEKGAVLGASIARRLADQTKGEKDIDWLLGELAKKFDHFQGATYTMVDIAELLEGATGKSWDRFFDERLNGTELLPPSEFSTSDLFGLESNGAGGKKLVVKGSGKSWLILLVAVLFLFLIPLIFSAYIRRSVKLDLTMPRILPEDEEENHQEEEDDS